MSPYHLPSHLLRKLVLLYEEVRPACPDRIPPRIESGGLPPAAATFAFSFPVARRNGRTHRGQGEQRVVGKRGLVDEALRGNQRFLLEARDSTR